MSETEAISERERLARQIVGEVGVFRGVPVRVVRVVWRDLPDGRRVDQYEIAFEGNLKGEAA